MALFWCSRGLCRRIFGAHKWRVWFWWIFGRIFDQKWPHFGSILRPKIIKNNDRNHIAFLLLKTYFLLSMLFYSRGWEPVFSAQNQVFYCVTSIGPLFSRISFRDKVMPTLLCFFHSKIVEKSSKIYLKSGLIYDMGFEHILAPLTPKMTKKRTNGTPKPPQEAPGAPQETPQTTQRGPMEAHGGPWGAQGMPLGTKSGHVGHI